MVEGRRKKLVADLERLAQDYMTTLDFSRKVKIEQCYAYNLTKLERIGPIPLLQEYRQKFLDMTENGL